MKQFGFIRLRAALSAGDRALKKEEAEFLGEIDPEGVFSFSKPSPDLPTVFFVATGGSEIYFKDCYENYPEPYCLLVQGRRNSLAASLEIKSFLDQKGKRCLLVFGEPAACHEALSRYHDFFLAEKKLRGMRLGVIGRPSDWLIASHCDAKELKKRFGIEIVRIPMKEFLETYDERILEAPEQMERFLEKTTRREDLRKSLYIHGALKSLCRKYSLNGFTLRCFDLLKTRQETSCLAFALLNDEGIIATCEGDVPTMVTMALAKALTDQPTFMANPSVFDPKKGEAIYAHCTCPLSMTLSYTLHTHFESGLGFGIRGEFPLGTMTMLKMKADATALRAYEVEVKDNLCRDDLCRSQIVVQFNADMTPLIQNPYGNHVAFLAGAHKDEMLAFFEYLTR